jgi:hypothetical protein
MHGRTPKVSHFHVFGWKCFILKKGKKFDKFEARSVDGIFFGYASHSRAYRVLNLETNQIVETCEVLTVYFGTPSMFITFGLDFIMELTRH